MRAKTSAQTRRVPSATWVVLLAVVVAMLLPSAADAKKKKNRIPPDLPEYWRVWLDQEVYPLISTPQRRAFLTLETETQRLAFVERLWTLWGRQTGYGAAFRGLYQERLAFVRNEFESTIDDRARLVLIHGPPSGRQTFRCDEMFVPLDFWVWGYLPGLGENVVVLLYQPGGMGPYRLWQPFETRTVLYTFMGWQQSVNSVGSYFSRAEVVGCINGDQILRLMGAAEASLRDPKVLAAMYKMPIRREDRGVESASRRFMEFSALVDDDAEELPFSIDDGPRGRRGGMVQMGFNVAVPSENLGTTPVGGVDVVQIDIVGEISQHTRMVDRFRYLFTVPSTAEDLGLIVERYLRPGDYELRLKVEDTHSERASVSEFLFTARYPTPEELAAISAENGSSSFDAELEAELAGDTVEEDGEKQLLRLVGPRGEGVSGLHRFEAVVRDEVARVAFLLNERRVLTKNRPPFDVDLDLGPLPRLTTVTAVGFAKSGEEIARRELSLNVGRERFYLRLQPLQKNLAGGEKIRVAMEVNIPSERSLEKLDVFWNDLLLATLYGPPFEAYVEPETGSGYGYLRAMARLDDGSQAEDLEFVNIAQFGGVVDVISVELPVIVLDKAGRPVQDLGIEDFTVFEDEVEQEISHFALHREVPIRLGLIIDTSGSMEDTLPEVQRVVMGFLRDLLRPSDRAYIETFSDRPDVLASFTADFGTLENALLSLYADRSTSFYDAMILGLFQFSGVRGRRAIVVLTDGTDTASKHSYDEVLAYAQRAGITIYAVGIDLPATNVMTRYQLNKLAKVTGGRAFFLNRDAELERIYNTINRELRTQYLIAYTSSSEKSHDELREIEVEVDRSSVKVRTVAGYYPGSL